MHEYYDRDRLSSNTSKKYPVMKHNRYFLKEMLFHGKQYRKHQRSQYIDINSPQNTWWKIAIFVRTRRRRRRRSLTSVVDIVNNVEVVFHRGAVRPAEAGGQEEEQHHSCRQPAAGQDAEPHISRSPRQHAGDSLRGTARDTEGRRSVKYYSLIHQEL